MDSDISLKIRENVPLAPLTTLKVGGPARFFIEARSVDEVTAALQYARSRDLDLFVLGGGSNIVISDDGFDGLVLQVVPKGITRRNASVNEHAKSEDQDKPHKSPASFREIVTADAGEDWDRFVEYCVGRGLAGIENLSGIPGFVGGTPVQNVGAYGQEVSETIVSVRCLDRTDHRVIDLPNEECGFAYRTSIFNTTMRERYIVLSVSFSLVPGGSPRIAYKDLQEHFAGREPPLAEVREAVLGIRAAKSMVIDPSDPNSQSAGSFFKNPIVTREKLAAIAEEQAVETVPHFPAGEMVKIPAAWLIEHAGFHKAYVFGNAGISTNHSLALINRGGATAAEIIDLKDRIAAEVGLRFGIELATEPIFVGFRD